MDFLMLDAEYLEALVEAVDILAACYGSTLALLEADTFEARDIETGRLALLSWAYIRGDLLEMVQEDAL